MGEVINFMEAVHKKRNSFSDIEKFINLEDKLAKLTISGEELCVIREYMLEELKVFLGLTLVDEEVIEEIEPMFFDYIYDVYSQANDYCYFCSDNVDPNDESYGEIRSACPICMLKLKSFLKVNVEKMKKIS